MPVVRANNLRLSSPFKLFLLVFWISIFPSQTILALEPGHPNLVDYRFFSSPIYLSKIWLSMDASQFYEAEFILPPVGSHHEISQRLISLIKQPGFRHPEMLINHNFGHGNRALNKVILHVSRLPQKAWNHGTGMDAMLQDISKERSPVLREELMRWALQQVAVEDFRQPVRSDHFNHAISYHFKDFERQALEGLLVEVEWQSTGINRPNEKSLFLVNIRF